ncbi:MAG: CDP-alcohol phosphatidyltransferase family protein [Chloroflexi bacterium HGW-Chloroflexi-9]|nr:MAG: CDP-alcohol phosphatidyltransferase family protein [Chloroflexi bacterium HGW-Chloroflexi-9]
MSRALLPRRAPAAILDPIVRVLASAGVSPAALTTAGFLGNVLAAVFVARGEFLIGGIFVLLFSALDMLDGALARSTGRASRFGALYDSVLDRVSEAVVLFGLAWWAIDTGRDTEALLAFTAVVGSLMVSYVRARAEGLGLALKDGLFTRSERVVLTGVALIIGFVTAALWALAVLTLFTAAQRTWIAARMLIDEDAPKGGR